MQPREIKGCTERAGTRSTIEYRRDAWKRFVGYSKRWKVEGTFFDMKRLFGETIKVFNLYKECRKELDGKN